jgi:peroxiredoxin
VKLLPLVKTLARRILGPTGPTLLAVGAPAPAFEAQDDRGVVRRLADFAGKRVILWFYPKAATPG